MLNSLPGYDTWLTNQPDTGVPEEVCDGCHGDLGDTVHKVKGTGRLAGYEMLLCEECAAPVERCDQCQAYRCICNDEREG